MSNGTEDVHLITEFSVMMHVKAQQIKARLRPFVQIKPMNGDLFAYDGIETVEARELFGRYETVKFDDSLSCGANSPCLSLLQTGGLASKVARCVHVILNEVKNLRRVGNK